MKKAFFMVGILAALSMTAFGADSDGKAIINLKGTAVKQISIEAVGGNEIDFGKVLATKTSAQAKTLNITGSTGQSVKIKADLSGAGEFIAIPESSGIKADYGTPLPLIDGAASAELKLEYTPGADTDSLTNEIVTVTATYDDIASN